MAATNLGAYLIIAYYNRDKWNRLSEQKQKDANTAAEIVFPEHNTAPLSMLTSTSAQSATIAKPGQEPSQSDPPSGDDGIPLPVPETVPIPDIPGVRMMRALHTGVHEQLPDKLVDLPDTVQDKMLAKVFNEFKEKLIDVPDAESPRKSGSGWEADLLDSFKDLLDVEQLASFGELTKDERKYMLGAAFNQLSEDEQNDRLEAIFNNSREQSRRAADTHAKEDPGIGWVAVVDAGDFNTFVAKMGSKAGPLWKMYDITVIPLNDDRTTKDVYAFMTPVSWNK